MRNERGLYVIRDRVAESSGPILEAPNHEVARRYLRQVLNQSVNPDDYECLYVGRLALDEFGRPTLISEHPTLITLDSEVVHE